MINLCVVDKMSCEVAALPFQVQAYYGTWSIDFGLDDLNLDLKDKSRNPMISLKEIDGWSLCQKNVSN